MKKAMIALLGFTLFVSAPAFSDGTLHGVRNKKCAPSDLEARSALVRQLAEDDKLCEKGFAPTQSGGWSCRSGSECPKEKFRCNTQYRCETKALDPTSLPTLPSPTPTPTPTVTSEAKIRDAWVRAVIKCESYRQQSPNPAAAGTQITSEVHGLSAGKCRFTVTVPNVMVQTCLFSEAQRKDFEKAGMINLERISTDPAYCTQVTTAPPKPAKIADKPVASPTPLPTPTTNFPATMPSSSI